MSLGPFVGHDLVKRALGKNFEWDHENRSSVSKLVMHVFYHINWFGFRVVAAEF